VMAQLSWRRYLRRSLTAPSPITFQWSN